MKHLNRINLILAVVVLTLMMGCASTAKKEGTGEYIDDSIITTKVKAAILNEPTLKSTEISVKTFKGVVEMSGFVNTKAEINKAFDLARGVRGVTGIKNEMHVK